MIKNERQYAVTKGQEERLSRALERLLSRSGKRAALDPLLLKAEQEALQSQLQDLRAELRVYEALRSGKRVVLKLSSLDELPGALIQARIAQGLSQKDLARRLGLKEQQIQRYEATDYASASLARLIRVSRALHLKVSAKAWTGNGIRNARSRETL
ncbi:MAG TPA: helix-turn-helix transcriptional regulator [Gemmataceae bacterium]|jgi:DNA-binding XRE family transcriptional regulator|nr:helix-turn-helix transcriptional regulator [Gemmataceae bacterium]